MSPSNVQNSSVLCMNMASSSSGVKHEKNMHLPGSSVKCEMNIESSKIGVKCELDMDLSKRMLGRYFISRIGRNLFV